MYCTVPYYSILYCTFCRLNRTLMCVFVFFLCFYFCHSTFSLPLSHWSTELQKPCPGQPTISEVLELVVKECRKDSPLYKMAALRCAGDVLHSSQEDRFSDMAEILIPLIKKVRARLHFWFRCWWYQGHKYRGCDMVMEGSKERPLPRVNSDHTLHGMPMALTLSTVRYQEVAP